MDCSPYSCTTCDVIALSNVHVAVILTLLQNFITSINSNTFLEVVKVRAKGKVNPIWATKAQSGRRDIALLVL